MPVRRVLASALLVVAAACTPPAPAEAPKADAAAIDQEIRAIDARWNELLAARNDSAIAEIYADDGVVLPPNGAKVSGRDGIRAFWASLWPANPKLVITPASVTAAAAGDLAVEEGTYALDLTMPDGSAVSDKGKYIVVWRKDAAGWRVVKDIYNSDLVPAAPAK